MAIIAARCPRCHAEGLLNHFVPQPRKFVDPEAIHCSSCGAVYPAVKGVPFLATYGPDDVVRLVETLAHLDAGGHDLFRETSEVAPSGEPPYHQVLYRAMRSLWAGEEEAVVLKNAGFQEKPWWWDNRKAEFQMFCWLTQGLDMAGKTVVDVGAGTGTDAMLFHGMGAYVIALEPDFITMARGVVTCPELHWLGGVAEALPLASESADFVVANASLHHHHDLSVSFPEMLRLLRCGGRLLTSGDPFKASRATPLEEDWSTFDKHASVLRGINEQILRLDEVLSFLAAYGEALETRVFLELAASRSKMEISLAEALCFVREEPQAWGSLGLHVIKKAPVPNASPKVRPGAFQAAQLLEAVVSGTGNLFRFVESLVPDKHLNLDLFGTAHDRWLQLNGWRKINPAQPDTRLAYERGRLFFACPAGEVRYLILEWMVPDCAPHTESVVEVAVNGAVRRRITTGRGQWHRWCVPLQELGLTGSRLCAELSLPYCSRTSWLELQPENHLAVKRFEISPEPVEESAWLSLEPSLAVLLGSLRTDEEPLLCCGPDGDAALAMLNQIRRFMNKPRLSIIVREAQRSFYAAIPWLTIECSGLPEGTDESVVFVLGCQRHSELVQDIVSGRNRRVWWLDVEEGVIAAEAVSRPALRDILEGRLPDRIAPDPSHLLQETQTKLREAKAKLAVMRAKVQKLKLKLEKGKAKGHPRRSWIARLWSRRPDKEPPKAPS